MESLRGAKRPGTAVSTLRTAAASVYRERSLTRITDELDRDCATWADAFSKAAAAAESLVASEAAQVKGPASDARRQSELLESLRLVSERLGSACMQVQYTRSLAAALQQVTDKLAESERMRKQGEQQAHAALSAEEAENEALRRRLSSLEAAGAAAAAPAPAPALDEDDLAELMALRREVR